MKIEDTEDKETSFKESLKRARALIKQINEYEPPKEKPTEQTRLI